MSSQSPESTKTDISKWPELFKTWSAPIGTLAGAVATLLITFFGLKDKQAAQIIGYAVVIVLVGVGILIYKRAKDKQQARLQRKEQRDSWAEGKNRSAFRGLYPYGENDQLPGTQRLREARRLVVQMTDPEFSFGIVCGDTGCGKTSLLRSEVQKHLKEEGERGAAPFRVLYVSNPRELTTQTSLGKDAAPEERLEAELTALQQAVTTSSAGMPLKLIVDQFEEFFIEYPAIKERATIGRFIFNCISASPRISVLCAIRRDFLVDMQDLAPNLPEPISVKTLFPVKNLTIEEASEIIEQCAKRDGITPDNDFALSLASDLAEGSLVRPPELQIICTALGENLTMAEYRLSGGAKGILSHHIENAVSISSDPVLGRRILRALSDFSAHAKKNPQTVGMLREAAGPSGSAVSETALGAMSTVVNGTSDTFERILRQFQAARLVLIEQPKDGDEAKYSLVHDYLVDAVAMATSDVSTRTEEANNLLQYYRAEYAKSRKTRVPFRQRRFIKRFADKKLLNEPQAKRLMHASLVSQSLNIALVIGVVLFATGVLVAVSTTKKIWRQRIVSNQGGGIFSNQGGNTRRSFSPKGEFVFTYGPYLRQWDSKSAKLLHTVPGDSFYFPGTRMNYLFVRRSSKSLLVDLRSKQEYELPPTTWLMDLGRGWLSFDSDESNLIYVDDSYDDFTMRLQQERTGWIWSVQEKKETTRFDPCEIGSIIQTTLETRFDRIIRHCKKGEISVPILYNREGLNSPAGLRKELHHESNSEPSGVDVSEQQALVAGLEKRNNKFTVELWDLQSGDHLRSSEPISAQDSDGEDRDLNVQFTPDGSAILVGSYRDTIVAILRVTDLRPLFYPSPREAHKYYQGKSQANRPEYIVWKDPEKAIRVWQVGRNELKTPKETSVWVSVFGDEKQSKGPIDSANVLITEDGTRAVLRKRGEDKVELWDFVLDHRITNLATGTRIQNVDFTIDEKFIAVWIEGGSIMLYSVENGEKIVDLQNIGGTEQLLSYDPNCHSVNVWTDEGRVLRYTEGRSFLNRESWFWPTVKCALN